MKQLILEGHFLMLMSITLKKDILKPKLNCKPTK